jgi:DNA modification methylase
MGSKTIEMAQRIEQWPVDRLIPYARNARTHSAEQVAKIAASIVEFGFTNPILVDGSDGIIAGHGRLMAARKLGLSEVPVIELTHLSEAQKRAYILADNRLALDAGWDEEMLAAELDELRDMEYDLALTGFSDKELAELIGDPDDGLGGDSGSDGSGSLSDRFLIPPFSVFNAREGWWQDRKRAWLALGIKSEEGRHAPAGGSSMPAANYEEKKAAGGSTRGEGSMEGTSIFDPVLCEIAYRWFSPKDGTVLDPFAGGSVRGIVAAKLGRQYVGNDLRAEQVEANRRQADEIMGGSDPMPAWSCGDSRNIEKLCEGVQADFIFSCPPYADLEVYSDNPADLSTLGYAEFRQAYRDIIAAACRMLKPNRFACFVVGEVRGKDGNYYNFVGDTVQAFLDAGLTLYNEAILVTAVGSLPIRAGKQFSASRKLGKTHQNVLVFLKGDAKKATAALGEIDVALPEGMEVEANQE